MSKSKGSYLVLTAMIFAVAMTFIDQTIVSISVPEIQDELDLSSTGVQWVVNGYLLTMAALFAFGGKVADVAGRRRMVVTGILVFATASALCGATPKGELAEPWIITFRVVQGAGAALMFPAALAITISAFPIETRGKAMALFFGITGALTSVGPIAGGFLTEWTWRSIFWINIPVALIALFLIWRSKPDNHKRPQPIDFRGAVLITGGMALAILGLQQSATWGWGSPATWGCIAAGLLILGAFFVYEGRVENPLIKVTIFKDRAFAVDCLILGFLSIAFVPLFLFASMYSQISLGYSASNAGLYLLIFFSGFATASQWGGRILDQKGARPAMILGSAVAAVGFYFWAQNLTDLNLNAQWPYIVLAGAGIGLILGPASTDAVNRAPDTSYGEATGITQTVRNFFAALGLAVLGSLLIAQNKINLESLIGNKDEADSIANAVAQNTGGGGGSGAAPDPKILKDIAEAFAQSTQTIFYVMAGVMAVSFLVALRFAPKGKMEEVILDEDDPPGPPGSDSSE